MRHELHSLATHQAWLTEHALAVVGDQDVAADVVQDTLVYALLLSSEQEPTRDRLVEILRAVVRRDLRKRCTSTLSDDFASRAPDPELAEQRAEEALALHGVVSALRPKHRQALLLRYWEGLTMTQVAAGLGTTRRNAFYVLRAARSSVRDRLMREYRRDSWV